MNICSSFAACGWGIARTFPFLLLCFLQGMWGLELLSPSGMNFAGLPVVDGVSITHSFQEALAIGLVDVPLIFGECLH